MNLLESMINNETIIITWSNYSPTSIRTAERRKTELENRGFNLVMQGVNSLTYQRINNLHNSRLRKITKELDNE